jgi:putative transposase
VIFTIIFILKECDAAFNADVNWAGNICFNINEESNSESAPDLGGHRSTGWLAQPGVYPHDLSSGFNRRNKW